jgi:ubiquinone/menaquinone biosynthesis C-methylase UbiE
MIENKNPYLIRKLEESSQYFSRSFSNRYMNWKRCDSIIKFFRREFKNLNKKEKPTRVLDIGCGDGWMVYRLEAEFNKKYRLEFTGVDISGFDIDFALQRKEYFQYKDCNFQVMDARDLKFSDQEFDIIISSELIEHILEPYEAVKEAYRVLKKGGIFVLTTPHKGGGLLARFLKLIRVKPNTDAEDPAHNFIKNNEISKTRLSSNQGTTGGGLGHVSVKSPQEWLEIFKEQGFKIISVKGTGGFLFGCPQLDKHRILFAFTIILDVFLEKLPFSHLWTEITLFELKKC